MSPLGRTLVGLAAGAFALTGLAAPALAVEPEVSVSILVQDADGVPVKNASLSADSPDAYLELGTTNAEGRLVAFKDPRSNDELTAGTWTLYIDDYAGARDKAGKTFVSVKRTNVKLVKGQNEIAPFSLVRGAVVKGAVKAPSGRAVRNVIVGAKRAGDYDTLSPTTSTGSYRLTGVGAGKVAIRVGRISVFAQYGNEPSPTNVTVTTKVGEVLTAPNVVKHQVTCDVKAFSVSSPTKGRVKLSVRASAASTGLTNPWGKIAVKVGSKTVKTFDVKKGAAGKTLTATVPATAGKKVTYKASYAGGDCVAWSSTKSVTVKKK